MSAELASIITCHPQQQRGGQLCRARPASTSFSVSAGAQHGACTLPRVGALWTLVDRMTNAIPFTRLRCRTELTHPDSGCVCPMHPLKRRHKSTTNQNFRILIASADRTWKMVCHNEPGLLLKNLHSADSSWPFLFTRIHPFHHLSDLENDLFPRPSYSDCFLLWFLQNFIY